MAYDSETPAPESEVTQMITTEQTSPVAIAEQLVGALTSAWRAIRERNILGEAALSWGSIPAGRSPERRR